MRLNQKIKYYLYRSISAFVAIAIVASSFTIDRSASALNPPPNQVARTQVDSSSKICLSNLSSVLDPKSID